MSKARNSKLAEGVGSAEGAPGPLEDVLITATVRGRSQVLSMGFPTLRPETVLDDLRPRLVEVVERFVDGAETDQRRAALEGRARRAAESVEPVEVCVFVDIPGTSDDIDGRRSGSARFHGNREHVMALVGSALGHIGSNLRLEPLGA